MRRVAINIYRLRVLLVLVLAAAIAAGLLALMGTPKPAEAAFPGAKGKIAFASDRITTDNPEGDFEIFAMNPDGTGIEQLTTFNTASDGGPAWSPEGNRIAFTSSRDDNAEIYVMIYGGLFHGRVFRLTTNTRTDESPTFSRDGNRIAFVSNRITTDNPEGDNEIYMMDTADTNSDGNGDNQINLTNNSVDDRVPAWSPDGSRIAFATNRDGNYEIYMMKVDGSDLVNLTNRPANADYAPNWSPDGSKIAFQSEQAGNRDIYVMDPDRTTDDVTRLTKKAVDDAWAAWSPDGKRIAFASERGGGFADIFVMKPRPESSKNRPKNLTKTEDDVANFKADWQPIPPPP
jgi:Tol biopolymer transport system component